MGGEGLRRANAEGERDRDRERHTLESQREPTTSTEDSLIAPVKRPAALGLWQAKIGVGQL